MNHNLRNLVKYFIYKSLSENIQTAEKYFFKSGKLDENDKNIILDITNGDEMTFKISEIYEYFKNHLTATKISANELKSLYEFYGQLKNYDKNLFPYYQFTIDKPSDDILGFWAYMREREYCIQQMRRLPSVFIRNMKSLVDTKRPQDNHYYVDDLRGKFKHLAGYLENVKQEIPEEGYQIFINKSFNSKVLQNGWESIMETLFNNRIHFLEVEEPFEEVIQKAKYLGAEIVEAVNESDMKYIVVRVFDPEQMREIGCGALWCLVTNGSYHWDLYTEWTEFAYIIFDYKATEKNYFKLVYCETDSQDAESIRESGLRMQLWALDNRTHLDDSYLESIGVDMDKINNQIDKAVAKKIKPKKDKKKQSYQHYDKNQLNIPFEDSPEYRQVAEQIRKIIKPPLLNGGSGNKQ